MQPTSRSGVSPTCGQLEERLLADHRLVHQHVVEHAAEGVVGRRVLRRHLDRLADRDAEAAGAVRVLGEDRAAGVRQVARARVHGAAEGLDHGAAVGLLVVRRAHLPDLALDVVLRARERQRGAPLARAGLGGELLDAHLGVVERLRHRGVRLVRPGRAHALVLVVDPGRRAESLLQPGRAEQRGRTPEPVDVEHPAGDLDVLVSRDLLQDQVHREQRRQVIGAHRLSGARVQHGRRWRRQVVEDVVPARRLVALGEMDLVAGVGHGSAWHAGVHSARCDPGHAGRGIPEVVER